MMNRSIVLLLLLGLLLSSCGAPNPPAASSAETPPPVESTPEVSEKAPAPITFASLPDDVEIKPITKTDALAQLELPNEVNVPVLTAWALRDAGTEALTQGAKNAAGKLWGGCTTEQKSDGMYLRPAVETGAAPSYISIANDGTLTYQASGEDTAPAEAPDEQTAVSLARALAAAFGLEERAWDDPYVETGGFDYDFKFTWSSGVNGLSLTGGGYLVVCVQGNQAGSLRMSGQNLLPVRDGAPDYFLSPEEALYCVNYARGLVYKSSVFYTTQELQSVQLVWSSCFAYPDYTPAYAFHFTNENGNLENTIYVDAFSGTVDTDTNEGSYSSPFRIG